MFHSTKLLCMCLLLPQLSCNVSINLRAVSAEAYILTDQQTCRFVLESGGDMNLTGSLGVLLCLS